MTEKSRTEYSARNTSIAMISRIIAILMGYVTRIVFTHTLSESYVGINGLFTDILNVLALSELGVGTALTYALYRPIAEHDIPRQKSLMRLFKWLYRCVAGLIAVSGLCVVPFLGYLVQDAGDVKHVTLIYLLYLLNSAVSYLLVYKKTLIDAHQRSYIGVLYHTVFLLIQYILQIVLLIATKNFVLYLLVYLLCTIGNNLCVAKKADSLYPYLKDRDIDPIPKEEKRDIVKNMKAMLMHKIGNVMVNNTDNILLTAMTGLVNTGKYSNYYLIIGSVRQVLDQAFQGITASVGNLGVTEDKGRVKKIFEASFFIGQWLYGFASICLFQLLNYIITFSFGENYLFTSGLVFVLCMNFFVTGMRQATLVFRDSLGLFWYDRYKSLAEAVINLVASVVLTLRFGVIGVFLGTFISTALTSFWIEPWVLYKKKLECSAAPYFIRYGLYSLSVLAAGCLTHYFCSFVGKQSISDMFADLLICVTVPNLVFLILYHRTKEFKFILHKGADLLKSKFKKAPATEEISLSSEDENLFEILKCAINGQKPPEMKLSEDEWAAIINKSERHAVLSLMYDVLSAQDMAQSQLDHVAKISRKHVLQSYRLSYCTYQSVNALNARGITSVVLKGVTVSDYYPTPELRKSGDIDILIPKRKEIEQAKEAMIELGYRVKEEQPSHHHIVLRNSMGIDIELHSMLAEPFDNSAVNNFLDKRLADIPENTVNREIMGYVFPVLSDGYQAYELLLHMLQHFLRSGFGLKLLCDWTVFWNRTVDGKEVKKYIGLVNASGLSGFSAVVTSACVGYLGLDPSSAICAETDIIYDRKDVISFLKDLIEAEEFGKSSKDRMVVLRGTSFADYFREFHHMMHLNFPKAGKVFILWPALWVITLIKFLNNNRKIRRVTAKEVLKKTKERSGRINRLELFRKK